jgi:hypothetical protein
MAAVPQQRRIPLRSRPKALARSQPRTYFRMRKHPRELSPNQVQQLPLEGADGLLQLHQGHVDWATLFRGDRHATLMPRELEMATSGHRDDSDSSSDNPTETFFQRPGKEQNRQSPRLLRAFRPRLTCFDFAPPDPRPILETPSHRERRGSRRRRETPQETSGTSNRSRSLAAVQSHRRSRRRFSAASGTNDSVIVTSKADANDLDLFASSLELQSATLERWVEARRQRSIGCDQNLARHSGRGQPGCDVHGGPGAVS